MSHIARVYEYMKDHGSITSLEAFKKLGCTRLSAYIFTLRKNGIPIESTKVETTNRYGDRVWYCKYYITPEAREEKASRQA